MGGGGGSLTLRHAWFEGNTVPGVVLVSGAAFELSNSVFSGNRNGGYGHTTLNVQAQGEAAWIYNNVLYDGEGTALQVQGSTVDVENTIVMAYDGPGFSGYDGATIDCVCSDSNGDHDIGVSGSHTVAGDPRFVDPEAGDFTLTAGFSPAIDAGNPLSGYDDADGTPNDLGAYGGPGGGW